MNIQDQVNNARKTLLEIKDYTQEQVDKLMFESAKIIYENAKPLAKMAVEKTEFGSYEDKIKKNTGTAAVFYDYLKDKKSVGIIPVAQGCSAPLPLNIFGTICIAK